MHETSPSQKLKGRRDTRPKIVMRRYPLDFAKITEKDVFPYTQIALLLYIPHSADIRSDLISKEFRI
ncbi:hypothetical protein QT972_14045, partial [Microcoleus sp. herbarium7]|uniref:hypothetical protein n=1 Tax=Microcoleus sp. herbarium7 TaxID=3055435 RepID=UPI002FD6594E